MPPARLEALAAPLPNFERCRNAPAGATGVRAVMEDEVRKERGGENADADATNRRSGDAGRRCKPHLPIVLITKLDKFVEL
jgi:hypothetical protein